MTTIAEKKTVTILRLGRKWSELNIAKAMTHFNVAVCADPKSPKEIAIVGKLNEKLVEEFRLAHEEFADLKVLTTHGVPCTSST